MSEMLRRVYRLAAYAASLIVTVIAWAAAQGLLDKATAEQASQQVQALGGQLAIALGGVGAAGGVVLELIRLWQTWRASRSAASGQQI